MEGAEPPPGQMGRDVLPRVVTVGPAVEPTTARGPEVRAIDEDGRAGSTNISSQKSNEATADRALRPAVASPGCDADETVSETPRSASLDTFTSSNVAPEVECGGQRAAPSEIESSDAPSPTSTDSSRRLACEICGRELLTTQALISHRKSCEQRVGAVTGFAAIPNCPPFALKPKPARLSIETADPATAPEHCAVGDEFVGFERRADGDDGMECSDDGGHDAEGPGGMMGEHALGSSTDPSLPFVCQRCGKGFTTIFGLGRHNGWCPMRPGLASGSLGPALVVASAAAAAASKKLKKPRPPKSDSSPTSAPQPPPSPGAGPVTLLGAGAGGASSASPGASSSSSPAGGPAPAPSLAPEFMAALARAPPAVRCDGCGKVFGSAQGLGQHRRHCAAGGAGPGRGRKASESDESRGAEEEATAVKGEPAAEEAGPMEVAEEAMRCPHCRKLFGGAGSVRRHLSRCPRLRGEGAGSGSEESEAESMEAPVDAPEPPLKHETAPEEAPDAPEAPAGGREAPRERGRRGRSGFACGVCGRTLMTRSGLVIHERHCKGPAEAAADRGPASPADAAPGPAAGPGADIAEAGASAAEGAACAACGQSFRTEVDLAQHRHWCTGPFEAPRSARQRAEKQLGSPAGDGKAADASGGPEEGGREREAEGERESGRRSLTCQRCKKNLISVQGLVIHVKFCKGGDAGAAPPPRKRVRNQRRERAREESDEEAGGSGGSADEAAARSARGGREAAEAEGEGREGEASPPGSPSAGGGARSPFACVRCGKSFSSAQGLGGHRSYCNATKAKATARGPGPARPGPAGEEEAGPALSPREAASADSDGPARRAAKRVRAALEAGLEEGEGHGPPDDEPPPRRSRPRPDAREAAPARSPRASAAPETASPAGEAAALSPSGSRRPRPPSAGVARRAVPAGKRKAGRKERAGRGEEGEAGSSGEEGGEGEAHGAALALFSVSSAPSPVGGLPGSPRPGPPTADSEVAGLLLFLNAAPSPQGAPPGWEPVTVAKAGDSLKPAPPGPAPPPAGASPAPPPKQPLALRMDP